MNTINNYQYVNDKWIFDTIPKTYYIKDHINNDVIEIKNSTLLSYQLSKSNYYYKLDDNLDAIDNLDIENINVDVVKKLVNNYNGIVTQTNLSIDTPADINLIGLNKDLNGNLHLNENELLQILNNKSESVHTILNNIIHNLQKAVYDNYDKLFPSLDDIINEKLKDLNLYNENAEAFINISKGNIIDFYK